MFSHHGQEKGQRNPAGKFIHANFFNHYNPGALGNLHATMQPKSSHFNILYAQDCNIDFLKGDKRFVSLNLM
jgi:hypothetical protein